MTATDVWYRSKLQSPPKPSVATLEFERLAALEPLGLGPLANVKTEDTVDLDGVLRQLEERLSAWHALGG